MAAQTITFRTTKPHRDGFTRCANAHGTTMTNWLRRIADASEPSVRPEPWDNFAAIPAGVPTCNVLVPFFGPQVDRLVECAASWGCSLSAVMRALSVEALIAQLDLLPPVGIGMARSAVEARHGLRIVSIPIIQGWRGLAPDWFLRTQLHGFFGRAASAITLSPPFGGNPDGARAWIAEAAQATRTTLARVQSRCERAAWSTNTLPFACELPMGWLRAGLGLDDMAERDFLFARGAAVLEPHVKPHGGGQA